MPAAGCTGWRCRPPRADPMKPGTFRALVQQHLLPLFSGAQLVPGHSSSTPRHPGGDAHHRGHRPGGSAPAPYS